MPGLANAAAAVDLRSDTVTKPTAAMLAKYVPEVMNTPEAAFFGALAVYLAPRVAPLVMGFIQGDATVGTLAESVQGEKAQAPA